MRHPPSRYHRFGAARPIVAPTLLTMLLLVSPRPSAALQLHWSGGATDLSFSQNTRAVLVVEADSTEAILPAQWRLLWVADSAGIQLVAPDSLEACLTDTAKVSSFEVPIAPADSAANIITARFCAENTSAADARYVFDLVGGSRGRLKAIALDPADPDSAQVLESNEVTYNGGVEGSYAPVLLGRSTSHHFGHLRVTATGAGLAAMEGLCLVASDASWRFSLQVVGKSDSRVVAEGDLAAPLPRCTLEGSMGGVASASVTLPADNFPPLDPQGGTSFFSASLDTAGMLAKDFAFVDAGDTWHIFYTREYQTGYTPNANQRAIGHAVSTDPHLYTWSVVDRSAIHARDGELWDNLHVWAPCVIKKPGDITYHMFYTGVQYDTIAPPPNLETFQIERLGVATSTNLIDWSQDSTALYWNKKVSWTFQDSTRGVTPDTLESQAWHFRDPFVMEDPDNLGRYLLYFITVDSCARISGSSGCSSQYVVGVARTPAGENHANLRMWEDVGPLLRTSQSHMAADRVESPTALLRQGKYWLLYSANHQFGDQLAFALNEHPASLDTSTWTAPDSLKAVTCGEHNFPSTLNQWHAPEALWFNTQEFLMAWSDDLFNGGTIQFSQVKPPDSSCPNDSLQLVVPDMVTAVEPLAASLGQRMTLALAGPCPVQTTARLRLSLSQPMHVHVAVYDVFGRRVRTLLSGSLPAGSGQLRWDGISDRGAAVSSGIYFVRATCSAGRQVVRIALVR